MSRYKQKKPVPFFQKPVYRFAASCNARHTHNLAWAPVDCEKSTFSDVLLPRKEVWSGRSEGPDRMTPNSCVLGLSARVNDDILPKYDEQCPLYSASNLQ